MKIKFPKKQKIRVIYRNVAIYTTVGKYAFTFGTGTMVNGTFCALMDLQNSNPKSTGIVRDYCGEQIQVDLLNG